MGLFENLEAHFGLTVVIDPQLICSSMGKSMTVPSLKGFRSLITTITLSLVSSRVTFTFVPRGNCPWAAVRVFL